MKVSLKNYSMVYMNYTQCEEYLEQLNTKGIRPGLDSINALLDYLNNPQDDLKIIHIAGTNGKGSTGCFIVNILKAQGYKVGHFSSPAVFEEREIITVNGRNISQKDYVNLINMCAESELPFTRFELETAMAYTYFRDKKCDFAVIECGMGGLLDATNVSKENEVSVFTSIGMDHMQYLGDTPEKIAGNKAGIIKKGGSTVICDIDPAITKVLTREAEVKENEVYKANPENIISVKYHKDSSVFNYKEYKKLEISMAGTFQPLNAATAIETIYALRDRGVKISDKAVIGGLHNAIIPGRFEKILSKPTFIIDGAHNEPASRKLRSTIESLYKDKKLLFIIGVLKDKEYDKVIENTCDLAWQIITVTSPNRARALPAYELAKTVSKVNNNVTSADSVEEAVELSLMLADKDTVIIAFGSLSYLNKVRETVNNRKDIKKDWHNT